MNKSAWTGFAARPAGGLPRSALRRGDESPRASRSFPAGARGTADDDVSASWAQSRPDRFQVVADLVQNVVGSPRLVDATQLEPCAPKGHGHALERQVHPERRRRSGSIQRAGCSHQQRQPHALGHETWGYVSVDKPQVRETRLRSCPTWRPVGARRVWEKPSLEIIPGARSQSGEAFAGPISDTSTASCEPGSSGR
jgi:hypothetical protein